MEGSEQVRKAIILEPLDSTLFFRDGKPFQARGHGTSGLPNPQTMAGALRTWFMRELGCDFNKFGADIREGNLSLDEAFEAQGGDVALVGRMQFRGPWLSLDDKPLFPVPSTLRRKKHSPRNGQFPERMLRPLKERLPGWQPLEEGMLPLWCKTEEPLARVEGFLTTKGMKSFLRGSIPEKEEFKRHHKLFSFDNRIGIGIDSNTMTTAEGEIYSVSLLALAEGVGFYAEVIGPEKLVGKLSDGAVFTFGGEKRHVRVRTTEAVEWDSLANRGNRGSPMLVLLTPGSFSSSWKPAWLRPISAAVDKPIAMSGWDLARGGPKPTRFLAPAGSVYYLSEELNRESDSLCDGSDAALGWGLFLEGRWSYA